MMSRFLFKHPPLILTVGFLLLIALGAVLLSLPFAAKEDIGATHALFTATSAVTVTGLAVVDTAQFTLFGQIVIMLLIQFGGLGFMTFAVLAMLSLQRQLSMAGQMAAQEAFGQVSLNKITSTAVSVVKIALFFEGLAFVVLSIYWGRELGWVQGMYQGLFYTISAFNNAGFALSADSLMPYVDSVVVNLTITTLIMVGGLGFLVLMDIRAQQRWQRFSVNTKVVLIATVVLNILAFVLLWVLEYDNANTLGGLSVGDQALAAWFQTITPRTAGFNTLNTAELTDGSTFLTIVLMFIGGGSLSTASGLKLGTFVVLLLTTRAYLRQQNQVTVFARSVPERQVKKALAMTIITGIMIMVSVFILLVIEERHSFLDVVFEVVSALSTVGLSRGLTSQLSSLGEWVLMAMMFAGRIGPLTLAYFIALPKKSRVQYAQTSIQVG
ncbi:TrkH family potassium uptake protein [Suttonella sp. R2A3]|uniref:TrkH family potassium uptake protein n=1 Tax=Suttonella sp. R2A3 TaxID=2908648 RepID=UPI001F3F926D|nr:TrkH family potassium uptake protein [Suttonella sp. R2A3]UJF24248.1 TrkH family potassium uptake protein [Suttonella sp. R2A3]